MRILSGTWGTTIWNFITIWPFLRKLQLFDSTANVRLNMWEVLSINLSFHHIVSIYEWHNIWGKPTSKVYAVDRSVITDMIDRYNCSCYFVSVSLPTRLSIYEKKELHVRVSFVLFFFDFLTLANLDLKNYATSMFHILDFITLRDLIIPKSVLPDRFWFCLCAIHEAPPHHWRNTPWSPTSSCTHDN